MIYTKALKVEKVPLVGGEGGLPRAEVHGCRVQKVEYNVLDECAVPGSEPFPVQIPALQPWLRLSLPICKMGLIIDSFTVFSE